jgi:hypothetical protein
MSLSPIAAVLSKVWFHLSHFCLALGLPHSLNSLPLPGKSTKRDGVTGLGLGCLAEGIWQFLNCVKIHITQALPLKEFRMHPPTSAAKAHGLSVAEGHGDLADVRAL